MSKNKLSQYQQGRMDGMLLAQKIARDGGIEELDKEIEFRNITGIHTGMAVKDWNDNIKEHTVRCFEMAIMLSVASMHDQFGIGKTRMERFLAEIQEWLQLLAQDYATWPAIAEEIAKQVGIEVKFDVL